MPDSDWIRDPKAEYWAYFKEFNSTIESRTEGAADKLRLLECKDMMPKFPLVHTCLVLGAISSGICLHTVHSRAWNSAPDYGGNYMWQPGCTVIDATDGSYCFMLPAEDSFHGEDDKQGQERFRSLSCRPLSGHEWLSAFGLQSEEALVDDVCASGDDENAPVMSMAALHEAWPSFLPAEDQNQQAERKEPGACDQKTKAQT